MKNYFTLFSLLFLAVGCAPAPDPGSVIRVGYFPNITHAQALIGMSGERSDFAKALDPNTKVDAKTFNAGSAEIEALFAGELDLAYAALRYYLLSNNLASVEKGGNVTIVPTPNPDIRPLFLRAAKNMGARGLGLYTRVILPAAFPAILTGMKLGWLVDRLIFAPVERRVRARWGLSS